MTKQNKKIVFIFIGVVVASYIVRSLVTTSMQMVYQHRQAVMAAQRQQAKAAQAAKSKPQPAAPQTQTAIAVPPQLAAPAPFAKYRGVWWGNVAIDGRGDCHLRFELRDKPGDSTGYSAFPTMTCVPSNAMLAPKDINPKTIKMNMENPEGSILAGKEENGSLRFHLEQVTGTSAGGCAFSTFSLTPFGAAFLAAEFTESPCQGGRVMLTKVGK